MTAIPTLRTLDTCDNDVCLECRFYHLKCFAITFQCAWRKTSRWYLECGMIIQIIDVFSAVCRTQVSHDQVQVCEYTYKHAHTYIHTCKYRQAYTSIHCHLLTPLVLSLSQVFEQQFVEWEHPLFHLSIGQPRHIVRHFALVSNVPFTYSRYSF